MKKSVGYLLIKNEDGSPRWNQELVLIDGIYYVQDTAKYSLFNNSEEMGKGLTLGQAIDDFMSKEKEYIEGLLH